MILSLIRGGLDLQTVIISLLAGVFVVFFTMPVHEFSHALTAYKLGDTTPKYQSRLTLNPLAHIDPIGALMIVLLGFGWAKPVSINPRNFNHPKLGMAITAFAGPFSNLVCALIIKIIYFIVLVNTDIITNAFAYAIALFLYMAARINISLAVFNLIPIPPLDGSKVLNAVLPSRIYFKIMQYERYIIIAVMLLIVLGVLDVPLAWLTDKVSYGIDFVASLPLRVFGISFVG